MVLHSAYLQPAHSLLLHDRGTSAVRRVEAKMADAVARGDRIVHLHTGSAEAALERLTSWLPEQIESTGQLELVSAEAERLRTGGRADDLVAAQVARVREARDSRYSGVTCSTDTGALLDLVAGPDDLLAYERAMHRLASDPGTTLLCCYPIERVEAVGEGLAARLAGLHFERVHDVLWTSRSRGGVLCIDGELDASNAGRLRAVLGGALESAMHTIDLRAVTYASSEAMQVFRELADASTERGETLRLIRVPAIVERALAVVGLLGHPGLEIHPTDPPSGDTGSVAGSLRVAEVFGELSRLEEATSEAEATAGLARILAGVIPSANHLSVTVGEPANPRVIDSTDQEAQKLDGHQMQAEEGPCQSAWETGRMVQTSDLRDDDRWPILTDLCRDADVVSVLALPVTSEGDVVGVINAYSSDRDAFKRIDVAIAELAAFAVGQVFRHVSQTGELNDMVSNLRHAMLSRSVIDQAKGILMARHGYDADEAFGELSRLSQQQNIKVRDLAILLTEEVREG